MKEAVSNLASVIVGQRLVNGWKNPGCPWTYPLTPDGMLLGYRCRDGAHRTFAQRPSETTERD